MDDLRLRRLERVAAELAPLVRDMIPRHPTSSQRINLIKRLLDELDAALSIPPEGVSP